MTDFLRTPIDIDDVGFVLPNPREIINPGSAAQRALSDIYKSLKEHMKSPKGLNERDSQGDLYGAVTFVGAVFDAAEDTAITPKQAVEYAFALADINAEAWGGRDGSQMQQFLGTFQNIGRITVGDKSEHGYPTPESETPFGADSVGSESPFTTRTLD